MSFVGGFDILLNSFLQFWMDTIFKGDYRVRFFPNNRIEG